VNLLPTQSKTDLVRRDGIFVLSVGTWYPLVQPIMEIYVKCLKINAPIKTEIFYDWNFVVDPCHLSIPVPPRSGH
jgi:hypothetical protein